MKDALTPQVAEEYPEQSGRHRARLTWIAVVTALACALLALLSFRLPGQAGLPRSLAFYISASLAIVALVSLVLAWIGRQYVGSRLLLTAMLLLTLALPYLAAGQVAAFALAALLLISILASFILPSRQSLWFGAAAAVLTIAVILADLFLPQNFGLRFREIPALPISAGLAGLYALFLLRRFSFYPLRIKLLIAFALVATIPLVVMGLYYNAMARGYLRQLGHVQLQNVANLAASQIDSFAQTQLDSIRTEAQQPTLAWYLELSPVLRLGTEQESGAAQTLASFSRQNVSFTDSYALLDTQGINVLDTLPAGVGQSEAAAPYFSNAMQSGQAYASKLLFSGSDSYLVFSAPIRNQNREIIGVLRARFKGAILQSIITPLVAAAGSGQTLALYDSETFMRIAFTGNSSELYKSYRTYSPQDLASFQKQGIFPPGTADQLLTPSNSMISSLQNLETVPFFSVYSESLRDQAVLTGSPVRSMGWLVVAARSESSLFAPMRRQTRSLVLISLALILAAALSSLLASQVLTGPIVLLTEVAQRISHGYLTAHARSTTHDEIGTLAATFNQMTYQLRQALSGLEERVKERTVELEGARQQSEARAASLAAISDIARAISGEQDLASLLPLVARLVSDTFGFYHTGIFLVDPTGQYAVLRAAHSEGGQRMLVRGHRLEVGQSGMVGYVARTGKFRLASDVTADSAHFRNPDLPATRSELALPLNIRARTIGVLDVQSEQPGAFDEDDINILSIMADQVAIAIDNARLFGQTQQALQEVEALYSQYLRQEWESFGRQSPNIGYFHTLSGGRALSEPVENEHIDRALASGVSLVSDAAQGGDGAFMVVPIRLRGEIIGILNIASPQKGREWNQDELELVRSISDRLALALENSRLLQDSLRRAAKEHKISQITSKISASMNMRSMLQTAAEELGRALPGSEVVIQFQSESDGAAQHSRESLK
ncbi:MAG TPA: GAF domain-containing protein [Anaerolineales bacterium]